MQDNTAQRTLSAGHFDRLPVELLHNIFGLLSQPDCLVVAGVCVRWRQVVTKASNYYAYLRLNATYNNLKSVAQYQAAIAHFVTQLHFALAFVIRLKLVICVEGTDTSYYMTALWTEDSIYELWDLVDHALLPHIPGCLAVLVGLDLSIPPQCFVQTMAVLQHPAPYLKELALTFRHEGINYGAEGLDFDNVLPSTLFARSAPCLTSVRCSGVPLGDIVPAFSGVRWAGIYGALDTQLPAISYTFHNTRTMILWQLCDMESEYGPPADFCPNLDKLCFTIIYASPLLESIIDTRPLQYIIVRFIEFPESMFVSLMRYMEPPLHVMLRMISADDECEDELLGSRLPDNFPGAYHHRLDVTSLSDGFRRTMVFNPHDENKMLDALSSIADRIANLDMPVSQLPLFAARIRDQPCLTTLRLALDGVLLSYVRHCQEAELPMGQRIDCPQLSDISVQAETSLLDDATDRILDVLLYRFSSPKSARLSVHGQLSAVVHAERIRPLVLELTTLPHCCHPAQSGGGTTLTGSNI